MSGVYIKGIEMPKSCDVCPFNVFKICLINTLQEGKYTVTHSCPIVPVPDHGDLIDRRPFVEFIKTHWDSYDQWFVDQLEARPTIIPADFAEDICVPTKTADKEDA